MSSEFNCVHAAREALQIYKKSGKDLSVIRGLTNISRIDVWQCVFEDEPEAYRELQIKELYDIVNDHAKDEISNRMSSRIFAAMLLRYVDHKSPLNASDAIDVVLDGLGDDFVNILHAEAIVSVNRRMEIVKPYKQKDNEWVNQAQKFADLVASKKK